MRLDCGICVVRSYRPDDAESLARHIDNPKIVRNLRDGIPRPYTEADGRAFIQFALSKDPEVFFGIEIDGAVVGGIGLTLHENVERVSAEVGYWLGESYWGRGIVTASLKGLSEWAFPTFGLTRIFAVPYAHNLASCRVLEKAGYQLEGIMRRSAIKDGVICDQALYACVR